MITKIFPNKISGEKLKEARLAKGYSTALLANLLGVTAQAINKYEHNACQPSNEILNKYVYFLEFPIEFFYESNEHLGSSTKILFRTMKTANDLDKEKLIVRSKWLQRIYNIIESYVDFPQVLIKQVGFKDEYDNNDIESIANYARKLLNVPEGPIVNLTTIIENAGGIIVRMPVNINKTDACSQWYENRPLFFLTSDKMCAVRSRFDLAHELGHFLLHYVEQDHISTKKQHEKREAEANRFASAFLLPEKEFSKDIYSTSIQSFINLKQKWKVSIGAMIYRCKDLNLLSENQISYLWRQLSSKGYKKREPLDDILKPEDPFILKSAIEILNSENILSPIELNNILNLPVNEISAICSIDEQNFKNDIVTKRVTFKFVK